MAYLLIGLYGLFVLVGFLNWALMRRPGRVAEGPEIVVLIPARNEADNLRRLIPALLGPNPGLKVLVFDDESEDETHVVAESSGAQVLRFEEPLPQGWVGKNWACERLGRAAEKTGADWFLFLDADVRPTSDFVSAMRSLCASAPTEVGMITGFPQVLPGLGIEPMFLAWVGWILLVTNPYGLVSRTGKGHNRFKNGQVHCWRREIYTDLRPHEQVRGKIMEDVSIGRLLAKRGIAVDVVNLSRVLQVKMYEHWRETLDGMSKNSFEITGTVWGSILVALLLLFLGWGWLLAGSSMILAFCLLTLSGLTVWLIARTALWPLFLMPAALTIGSYTILRSMIWHMRGTVRWKGRVYGADASRRL